MKIAVIGTRGFPNVQGGVEAHCEKLYPRLVKLGCDVTVFTRKPYVDVSMNNFKGVDLIPVDCPESRSFEAIVHSMKCVLLAKKLNFGVVHIHAVGPSLVAPLARLLGLRVVMTNHGPDYWRKKWGMIGRLALRAGEEFGSYFSNEIICVSKWVADRVKRFYYRDAHVIPNGIEMPEYGVSEYALRKYSLVTGRYILAVGRFVPEKGFHDLIKAFSIFMVTNDERRASAQRCEASPKGTSDDFKLVIVGRADHEDRYSRNLERIAKEDPNVILTGFLSGEVLRELYSHAGLFALPSYYEGLPIALLEAMSYGLSCIASDIPANREVGLREERYFKPGDIKAISAKIVEFASRPLSETEKQKQIGILRERYDWDDVARKTLEVYKKLI